MDSIVVFRPDRRYTWASAIGAVVAVLVAVQVGDGEGRVLAATAAVVLGIAAGCDVIFSPRLAASTTGLMVRAPLGRAELTWSEVHTVRVVERTRRGLRSSVLEIDAGEFLAEFTRRTLGCPVDEACAAILDRRPAC